MPGSHRRGAAWAVLVGTIVAGGLVMGGCSSDSPAGERAETAPGDFPDVNKVPTSRPQPPTLDELNSVTEGLVADREASRHARQGTRRAPQEIDAPVSETPVSTPPREATEVGTMLGVGPAAPSTAAAAPTPVSQPLPAPAGASGQTITRVAPGTVANAPAGSPGPAAVAARPSAAPTSVLPASEAPAMPAVPGSGTVVIDSAGVHQENSLQGSAVRRLDEAAALAGGGAKVGVVYFASSSSDLDNNDLRVIAEIADYQRENGGVLRVIGHSSSRTGDMDPVSHKILNLRVSAERADAVAQALMSAGVFPANIVVGAVADDQKEYREVMPSGEAFNRRAEIFLE
ncbi:OmpA family protein [Rhodospirillum rubrum]|nr:OmpA family protein [Rhodospirillum rubrum]AEO48943.1 OmpA/MotB [Rhodospirillum rubrum F11]